MKNVRTLIIMGALTGASFGYAAEQQNKDDLMRALQVAAACQQEFPISKEALAKAQVINTSNIKNVVRVSSGLEEGVNAESYRVELPNDRRLAVDRFVKGPCVGRVIASLKVEHSGGIHTEYFHPELAKVYFGIIEATYQLEQEKGKEEGKKS